MTMMLGGANLRFFTTGKHNESQPNIYDSYRHLTAAEKQARQRERRLERRKGANASSVDPQVFKDRIDKTLARLFVAFEQLVTENEPGRIKINLEEDRLNISVKKIGNYIFSSDSNAQTLSL